MFILLLSLFIPISIQQVGNTIPASLTGYERSLYYLDMGLESILARQPYMFGNLKIALSSGLAYASENNELDGILKIISDPWALRFMDSAVVQTHVRHLSKESLAQLLRMAAHEYKEEALHFLLNSHSLVSQISQQDLEYIVDVFIQSKRFDLLKLVYDKHLLSPRIYGDKEYFEIYIKSQKNGMPSEWTRKFFIENQKLFQVFLRSLEQHDLNQIKEYLSVKSFVFFHKKLLESLVVSLWQDIRDKKDRLSTLQAFTSSPYLIEIVSDDIVMKLFKLGIRIHSTELLQSLLIHPKVQNLLSQREIGLLLSYAFRLEFAQIIYLFKEHGLLSKLNHQTRRQLLSFHSFKV